LLEDRYELGSITINENLKTTSFTGNALNKIKRRHPIINGIKISFSPFERVWDEDAKLLYLNESNELDTRSSIPVDVINYVGDIVVDLYDSGYKYNMLYASHRRWVYAVTGNDFRDISNDNVESIQIELSFSQQSPDPTRISIIIF
jgi:hypothetical protein